MPEKEIKNPMNEKWLKIRNDTKTHKKNYTLNLLFIP